MLFLRGGPDPLSGGSLYALPPPLPTCPHCAARPAFLAAAWRSFNASSATAVARTIHGSSAADKCRNYGFHIDILSPRAAKLGGRHAMQHPVLLHLKEHTWLWVAGLAALGVLAV